MKRSFIKAVLASGVVLLATHPTYAQSLEQRIDRLERMSSNPVLLQQSQRIENQQKEIQSLYDLVERLEQKLNQLEQRQETQFQDLNQQVSELKVQGIIPVMEPELIPEEEEIIEEATSSQTDLASYKDKYDAAFALLRNGDYDASIDAFNSFVKDYPKEDLTGNGYYWLGEAYLIKQDYQAAFDSFNEVVDKHRESSKVVDSLLRGADSLVGLNKLNDAKAMYQDLIARFPDSNAAKSAKRRLEKF